MPPGNTGRGAFSRLRELPIFDLVHERVIRRWPPTVIARMIQDAGFYDDVKPLSLVRQIKRYRASLVNTALDVRGGIDSMKKVLKIERLYDQLNRAMVEYRQQLRQLSEDRAKERELGRCFAKTEKDELAAANTLRRIEEIKRELGIDQLGTEGSAA